MFAVSKIYENIYITSLQNIGETYIYVMKIYVSYVFRKLKIFIFFCILDTTNMVKTCDYL